MLRVLIDSLVIPLVAVGSFFFLIGTLGLLRFPDTYSRIHVTSKCDTFGAGTILLALTLYEPVSLNTLKIVFLLFLIFVYSPTAGHLLARAAFRKGMVPWRKEVEITYRDEQLK